MTYAAHARRWTRQWLGIDLRFPHGSLFGRPRSSLPGGLCGCFASAMVPVVPNPVSSLRVHATFSSPLLAVSHVACSAHPSGPGPEEPVASPRIILPRRGLFVYHVGGASHVADHTWRPASPISLGGHHPGAAQPRQGGTVAHQGADPRGGARPAGVRTLPARSRQGGGEPAQSHGESQGPSVESHRGIARQVRGPARRDGREAASGRGAQPAGPLHGPIAPVGV